MTQSLFAIGLDLGGTRIKGVLVDAGGRCLQQLYVSTNDDGGDGWKQAVKEAYLALQKTAGQTPYVLGLSAPGIPDEQNRCIAVMPGRLQGLEGFDWSAYLGHPCHVVNDAIAAMAAEARFGNAVGVKHAALLTLGTGVGGALLIDGRIHQGAFQKAGHIGHISVDAFGAPDITGMPGSLEDAIGNCTIQVRSGGRFSSTHDLLEAHRKGDAGATKIWMNSLQCLAVAMASIVNVISPERIIIGGGITEAGDDLFVPLLQIMEKVEWKPGGKGVDVVKAAFGDLAGAMGAASFALMQQEEQF